MRVSRKLALMAAGTMSIILVVGISSLLGVSSLITADDQVAKSKQILIELNMLLYNLSDTVETQRNYIVTGKEPYLEAYQEGGPSVLASVDKVQSLVADDAVQLARVEKLRGIMKQRLASLETTLQVFKDQGEQAAVTRIKNGKSLALRIELHKAIDEMKDYEIQILDERNKQMKRTAYSSQMTVVAGCLLALAFVTVFNFLFAQSILSCIRQLIRAAENIKYGRFDLGTTTNSDDEFAELGAAFNTLGQQLLAAKNVLKQQQERTHEQIQGVQQSDTEKAREIERLLAQLALSNDRLKEYLRKNSFALEQLEVGQLRVRQLVDEMISKSTTTENLAHSLSKEFLQLRTASDSQFQFINLIDVLLSKMETISLAAELEQARSEHADAGMTVLVKRLKELCHETATEKQQLLSSLAHLRTMTSNLLECYADAIKTIELNKAASASVRAELQGQLNSLRQLNMLVMEPTRAEPGSPLGEAKNEADTNLGNTTGNTNGEDAETAKPKTSSEAKSGASTTG